MVNSFIGQVGFNVKVFDENGNIQVIYDFEVFYIVVYMYNFDCEYCQEQMLVLVNLYC